MTRAINLFLILICLLEPGYAQYRQNQSNLTQLLVNRNNVIPFTRLDDRKIAVITNDSASFETFINQLKRYGEVTSFGFEHYDEDTKYYNTLIIAGDIEDLGPNHLALALHSAVNNKDVILSLFGPQRDYSQIGLSPTNLGRFTSIIQGPSSQPEIQKQAAMSIFGGMGITQGAIKTEQSRLQYSDGKQSGLDLGRMTLLIDAIAEDAIQQHATPGMMVMAVKGGQVIFEKAYGHHTYAKTRKNSIDDIYDLASISKIAGTTPVIMHLQEQQVISLDSTMGHYLWQAKESNKAQTSLRTVLLHEGGFTPFIPFYRHLKSGDLQHVPSETHQVQVSDNAFLRNNYYRDVMWPEMLSSPVKPIGNYVYSDISMYVMKEIAEHETATPIEEYVQQILYRPIGMKTAGYLPRTRFDRDRIVPTQNDTAFRKELLQGFVHDEGAAMAGGVAGHAGLFASANDLAIYGQLLLNRGEYGGVHYYKPETVDLFTSKQSATSRRGLGFDRHDPRPEVAYPSKLTNNSVFGHTGYTGTCIWMDPANQLIYIFLSNRVHPQVSDKIYDLNVRSRIQDVIYETIANAK